MLEYSLTDALAFVLCKFEQAPSSVTGLIRNTTLIPAQQPCVCFLNFYFLLH